MSDLNYTCQAMMASPMDQKVVLQGIFCDDVMVLHIAKVKRSPNHHCNPQQKYPKSSHFQNT